MNASNATVAAIAAFSLGAISANAAVIVGTNFTGRTISGTTATITDYTLNGVSSPGNWTVVDAGSLFTTTGANSAVDHFAVADNPPTWSVTIPLAVGASAIDLDDVTINFESFTNAGVSKVPTNNAPANNVTVEIRDSLNALLATQNLGQVGGSTADYWIGTYTSMGALTLAAGQTYSLKITTGGEVGNNFSIDSFAINGTVAVPEPSAALLGGLGLLALL
ncbi:MAG: hypothetical protein RLZZ282_262, partial [Verrucomicrobiota bacterium]